jgi:hypothetical protein
LALRAAYDEAFNVRFGVEEPQVFAAEDKAFAPASSAYGYLPWVLVSEKTLVVWRVD